MKYLKLIRPNQWIKNLLIFAPVFFGHELFFADKLEKSIYAFVVFTLIAGSLYIFNDIFDRRKDGEHPVKSNRPIASGAISVSQAVIFAVVLFVAALFLLLKLVPSTLIPIGIYVILNILYTLWLKRVAIVDILIVASFYVVRIAVGGVATNISLSGWLVLCVFFAALLIVGAKRRAELSQPVQREVLKQYNAVFLEHLLSISAALALISYGLYSILGTSVSLVVYSNIFVVLGIFRYLLLVYKSPRVEFPEKIFLSDGIIVTSIIAWAFFMFITVYVS